MTFRDHLLVVNRGFHRPTSGHRFHFFIHHAAGFPIASCRLNGTELSISAESSNSLVWQTEVTGIIGDVNAVSIAWRQWPAEIVGTNNAEGHAFPATRYIPSPNHPLHLDSWLEIQEEANE